MDFFILDDEFRPKDVIDTYESAIWTERYSSAGDVNLVVDATADLIQKLTAPTYLALTGTKEIMQVETQLSENGLLTVTGTSLLTFLNERLVWVPNVGNIAMGASWVSYPPGFAISYTVNHSAIATGLGLPTTDINLDWENENIPNLTLGDIDESGELQDMPIAVGPIYDAIQPIAETYSVGISLYLDSVSEGDYSLKFKTYAGKDRTSDQDDYPLIRFSPVLNSLNNLKELHSIANYKNVAYGYTSGAPIEIVYADPDTDIPVGLDRRVLMVEVTDIPAPGDFAVPISTILRQRATDALANHNYIHVVDGEVTPQSEFQFGTHYDLGDIVELESLSGLISKARITEYIRTQDGSGERAYPSISVIN